MNSFIPSSELCEQITAQHGTPIFVTNAGHLRDRLKQIKAAFSGVNAKIFYAIKANFNPHIARTLQEAGLDGIDTVSVFEAKLALDIGFSSQQIIFTGSNPSTEDLHFCGKEEILVNAGSLSEVKRFGAIFPGKDIAIRLNPDIGAGEHKKIITGFHESKFGILPEDFVELRELLKEHDLRLSGIHCHIGSGFYDADTFAKAVAVILSAAESFPDLDFVDFGGGFGIHYHPDKDPVDLPLFGKKTAELVHKFSEKNGRKIEVRLEPGKFLVGESTCLLTKITTRKKGEKTTFLGTDTGFNHLVRPMMYDSYHHIVHATHPEREKEIVDVVGNICETGDIFGENRSIARAEEGDTLAILTAGAYGSVMSSNYNLNPLAAEVLVDGDQVILTRKRQSYEQMCENFSPL